MAITTGQRDALVQEQCLALLDETEALARHIQDHATSDKFVSAIMRAKRELAGAPA